MRKAAKGLLVVLGIAVAVEAFLLWAFRSGNPWAIRNIRHFNKVVLNPVMVRFSGRRGFYAATLHHVGRRSGTPYATPVLAHRSHDHLVMPLPYGTEVDWLHNLLAAGRGMIDVDGRTFTIEEPAVLGIDEVGEMLPDGVERILRLYGTRYVVRMLVSGIATPASA